jgi:uncharacterized protein
MYRYTMFFRGGEVPMSVTERARGVDAVDAWQDGFARPRVFLQPIAPPSILGLFGFCAATAMVGAYLAGWYGNATTPGYLFPFAAIFGGVAQLLAGMWAYRARDGVATAMHGMWGSFWIAFGILNWLVLDGRLLPIGKGEVANTAIAFWFVTLCAITLSGALASLAENLGMTLVLAPLAAASGINAVGYWIGSHTWVVVAGWVFVASACAAWYVATAMMMSAASGRTILPLGHYRKAANVPGQKPMHAIELEWGEPGVKHGQ